MGWKKGAGSQRSLREVLGWVFGRILGDGGLIRFWEDTWCGEIPLCDQFPTLFAMVASKGAKVGEVWDTTRGEGGWNLRFRSFNDWEMEEI